MGGPRRRGSVSGVAALALVAMLAPAGPGTARADEIDLEIFNLEELENAPNAKISGGCSMTLWQHNKVPFKDKYYFVFYRDILGETSDAAGYIQINGTFEPVTPFATGGADHGYELRERQVYRGRNGSLWVIMDLTIGKAEGEVIRVDDGSMRVVASGKKQFRVKVKGEAGC